MPPRPPAHSGPNVIIAVHHPKPKRTTTYPDDVGKRRPFSTIVAIVALPIVSAFPDAIGRGFFGFVLIVATGLGVLRVVLRRRCESRHEIRLQVRRYHCDVGSNRNVAYVVRRLSVLIVAPVQGTQPKKEVGRQESQTGRFFCRLVPQSRGFPRT